MKQPGAVTLAAVGTIAVLAISSAAVLIRSAQSDALVTAWYRVGLSAVILAPVALRGPRPTIRWRPVIIAGVALALHFWAWMLSLELTSVASSTLIVTTSPLWVALAAIWMPRERRLTSQGWAGVALCLAGGAVLALAGDAGRVSGSGSAYALAGALLAATYFLASSEARRGLPVAGLAMIVNAVAFATLTPAVLISGAPFHGFDTPTWLALAALALIPQLVGHNALIWLLRYMSTTTVTLLVLLEPVGASLLAWPLFNEPPQQSEVAGGALLLIGLAVVVWSRRGSSPTSP